VSDPPRPRRPWDLTAIEEREYGKILGRGLVAVVPGRAPSRSANWSPPTGGAWVHVGADGSVRAFTGKAEVGQGTRPALRLLVAEELSLPPDRVEMVMADTDLCPWDMGTFGSRSMPDAAPALARAAAGAREALVALAAARWGVPKGHCEVLEGRVRRAGSTDSIPYGALVADRDRVDIVPESTKPRVPGDWRIAGHPFLDPDGSAVVTGRRRYTSDLVRSGMGFGALVWPPWPGAHAALLESPGPSAGNALTVVEKGEVVGVVADDPIEARTALAQLPLQWDGTAPPDEREIEAYLRSHPQVGGDAWDTDAQLGGDPEGTLARAPVTLSATYRTAYIAHVPLETHCAVAEWEDGRVTIWVGTQTPFRVRESVARSLDMKDEDVRIIVPPTGAGFGGKHGSAIARGAARLARAAKRPVRVAFSREEEFHDAYLRPMAIIDVRAAATPDGHLSAWTFRNVNAGSAALFPPYKIPNLRVDNVLSDAPFPQGAYRSLAAVANNFARESAIDELAVTAGADPVAFRKANLSDDRLGVVLDRAAQMAGWSGRPHRPGHGFGIAVGLEKASRIATIAEVEVDRDRRLAVKRLTAVFEAGALVHPDNMRSQVEGALVMALGGALFERIRFGPRGIATRGLSEYRVPRLSDLPELAVELIDRKDLPPAGGGETPMIAVAPAVANAVFDATGIRIRELPMAPDGTVPKGPTAA
jgi:nicotinate dehydrogenase subunit B